MGFHLIAGASILTQTTGFTTKLSIIYRDTPLDFPATPTGVDPEVFHRSHIEARGGVKLDLELF